MSLTRWWRDSPRGCRWWLIGCGVTTFLVLGSVGWFFGRIALAGRRAEALIQQQGPGLWAQQHYPFWRGGPLVLGVPDTPRSAQVLRDASRRLDEFASRAEPGGLKSTEGSRFWCVPLRLVNYGDTRRLSREYFILTLQEEDGSPAVVTETPAQDVLTLVEGSRFPYREMLRDATRVLQADQDSEWLLVFSAPAKYPLRVQSISRLDCRVGPYGFTLLRRE